MSNIWSKISSPYKPNLQFGTQNERVRERNLWFWRFKENVGWIEWLILTEIIYKHNNWKIEDSPQSHHLNAMRWTQTTKKESFHSLPFNQFNSIEFFFLFIFSYFTSFFLWTLDWKIMNLIDLHILSHVHF